MSQICPICKVITVTEAAEFHIMPCLFCFDPERLITNPTLPVSLYAEEIRSMIVFAPLNVSSDGQFTQKSTPQHGAEISHVHRHDSQHPRSMCQQTSLAYTFSEPTTYSK